jgi:hypothetical protein
MLERALEAVWTCRVDTLQKTVLLCAFSSGSVALRASFRDGNLLSHALSDAGVSSRRSNKAGLCTIFKTMFGLHLVLEMPEISSIGARVVKNWSCNDWKRRDLSLDTSALL